MNGAAAPSWEKKKKKKEHIGGKKLHLYHLNILA